MNFKILFLFIYFLFMWCFSLNIKSINKKMQLLFNYFTISLKYFKAYYTLKNKRKNRKEGLKLRIKWVRKLKIFSEEKSVVKCKFLFLLYFFLMNIKLLIFILKFEKYNPNYIFRPTT